MKKPPRQYEDEPEGSYVNGVGSYQRIGDVPKGRKTMEQIGFIRKPTMVKRQPKRK